MSGVGAPCLHRGDLAGQGSCLLAGSVPTTALQTKSPAEWSLRQEQEKPRRSSGVGARSLRAGGGAPLLAACGLSTWRPLPLTALTTFVC